MSPIPTITIKLHSKQQALWGHSKQKSRSHGQKINLICRLSYLPRNLHLLKKNLFNFSFHYKFTPLSHTSGNKIKDPLLPNNPWTPQMEWTTIRPNVISDISDQKGHPRSFLATNILFPKFLPEWEYQFSLPQKSIEAFAIIDLTRP